MWETTDAALIAKIRNGTVTQADLSAAGAVQHGVASDDYDPGCPDTGNGCVNFYAVSIFAVTPSANLTWFQAAAARNADKRLPSNAEWQAAALGTLDDAAFCNTSGNVIPTGGTGICFSQVGASDMVGNLWEWVADWARGAAFQGSSLFGGDLNNLGDGGGTSFGPSALIRGGSFTNGTMAGVYAVGLSEPSVSVFSLGFRCAR